LGIGVGGLGGNGGTGVGPGVLGRTPGGGLGGSAATTPIEANSGDGQAFIFFQQTASAGAISLSHRKDVTPGNGILNYLPGQTFPTIISDEEIGSFICEEWWIVSGNPNITVQVTEYLYEDPSDY
jgi:hypothetical protein